ncbi:sperm-associated antigen 4 protein-like [Calypte anna]|uniref:sperm-associated antigen 4 protein-like n=1 Tax=Calypte anna TaxID=9244 RepID=UPI0011C3F07C|nr:sperm-associated antigen 4 protein-like [Calypte anna]
MRGRSAPAGIQSTAQSRRRARSNTAACAAQAIRVLQNRRTPSQEEQDTRWEGPAVSIHTAGRYQWMVFSIAYSLTAAVLSLQRRFSTAISILNVLTECQEHVAHELQQLRAEVSRMAAEIIAMKKEAQEMQEAMSATTWMSDWALRSAVSAIQLQRSSSSPSWLCRVFFLRCAAPVQDTFVQLDYSPGYCWPFQGIRSEVLIQLPTRIQPMAITLQHTSSTGSPPGIRGSAPRDFSVYGLDEEAKEKVLLGTFTYAIQKELNQTFPLQHEIPRAFRFLKLDIWSNWGKGDYTCIYRVKVHGQSMGRNAIS